MEKKKRDQLTHFYQSKITTMQTNNLNSVKVIFTDSQYNYETNVSATTTEQTAKEYFVNKTFDLGSYPKENYQKCIAIEFTDNNKIN